MQQNTNITCEVIRDLLPLYVDDILSAGSRALVDNHLPECPACANELNALRRPAEPPKFNASTGLKRSKKRLRKLVIAIASGIAVIAMAASFVSIRVFTPDRGPMVAVSFEENPINLEALYRYTAARGDTGSEAEFLWVEHNRLPQFEWGGAGSASAEDVIMIDGERVGVAFVQIYQQEDTRERALRDYERRGRNDGIIRMGGMGLILSPISEAERAEVLAYRNARMDGPVLPESPSLMRDIPITRVYYYNGDVENFLHNEPIGWSERAGILEDSVLIWDAETSPQGTPPPGAIHHGRQPETGLYGEVEATVWDKTTALPVN